MFTGGTRKVGKCIYCRAERYEPQKPELRLTDEHIVPLGLGGRRVLREATCRRCQIITSEFESRCVQALVAPGRQDLGIQGRRTNRKMRRAAAAKKPTFLMMFKLEPPGMLTGGQEHDWPASRILIRPLTMRGVERGSYTVEFRHGGGDTKTFSRLIAKIAHAHAVDVFGLGGFEPLTTNLIREIPPLRTSALVGAASTVEPTTGEHERHTLREEWATGLDGTELLLVRVRLFGDKGMPTYVVVVGTRPAALCGP
jgi:hypothetical protein